jgi:hypothetical protein
MTTVPDTPRMTMKGRKRIRPNWTEGALNEPQKLCTHNFPELVLVR